MQKKYVIDINADLGEGAGQDELLMPFLSSCNIAAGGHAGDQYSIQKTIQLAQKHGVKVGAHPSYPDTENFGRKVLDLSSIDLREALLQQISTFYEIASKENSSVHHIKAHGALYNQMAKSEELATLFLDVLKRLGIQPALYVPFNSVIYNLAKERFTCISEVFIDRKYHDDLTLVSRKNASGLIKTPVAAWEQLYDMVVNESVKTIENTSVAIKGETFCIHGDHPNAVQILTYLKERLNEHAIHIG